MNRLKTTAIYIVTSLLLVCCNHLSGYHSIEGSEIDNLNEIDSLKEDIYSCNCLDTLKGEWKWIKAYGGFLGTTIDNEYKSILKILNQNEDASINYEIFVDDTLFFRGSFQLKKDSWNINILRTNIKLPHHWRDLLFEDWFIFMGDMQTMTPSENILCFTPDGITDDYIYYYQKIKIKEE